METGTGFLSTLDMMATVGKMVEAINKICKAIYELKLEECWNTIVEGAKTVYRWFIDSLCFAFPFLKPYLKPEPKPASTDEENVPMNESSSDEEYVPNPEVTKKKRVHGDARLDSLNKEESKPIVTSSRKSRCVQGEDRLDAIRNCRRASPVEDRRSSTKIEDVPRNCRPVSPFVNRGPVKIEDVPSDDEDQYCKPDYKASTPCSGPDVTSIPVNTPNTPTATPSTSSVPTTPSVPTYNPGTYPGFTSIPNLPAANQTNMGENLHQSNVDPNTLPQRMREMHANPTLIPQAQRMSENNVQAQSIDAINEGINALNFLCALADPNNTQGPNSENLHRQRENMISLLQSLGR